MVDVPLSAAYRRHDRRMREVFADKPDGKWLAFNEFAGDGWPELCAFLGQSAPALAFPGDNAAVTRA